MPNLYKVSGNKIGAWSRRAVLFFALAGVWSMVEGCKDDNESFAGEAKVEPTTMTFGAKKETKTLRIEAYGDWTITVPAGADWVTVSALNGRGIQNLDVTVSDYFNADTVRKAVLKVDCGRSSFTVALEQGKREPNNLSAAGTANCYLAPTSGTYMIEAAFRGSSKTQAVGDWKTVDLLWEDQRGLISDLHGEAADRRIFFTTAGAGNAVVAVRDAAGKILWSWHIWATSFDPAKSKILKYENANGSVWEFMDRNLGAGNVTPGDFDSFGLIYQWGRKDPFTAAAAFASENPAERIRWNMAGNPLPDLWMSRDSMGSVDLAIANPTKFYVTRYADGDWADPSDIDLWGGVSGQKTVYDPCPAGWRVPAYDAQGASPYAFVTRTSTTATEKIGRIYKDEAGNEFLFPVAGSRIDGAGLLDCPGNYASLWTATGKTTTNEDGTVEYGCMLFYTTGRLVSGTYYNPRSQGVSVRCVKE